MIFPSNIGLDCLYLLQNPIFVFFIIAIELIIVIPDPLLQSLQHFFTQNACLSSNFIR